ncbi:branched-chain amino acid aminotransferase [Pseudoflavonifractor phocaeensis]|uniref:branched-chain amino acid aminotransferase n=1 Tax=Pseudoflavonifractor phocaeensis TaxID=1870988 RepID=UPI0019573AEA|nr:branched-chain amino acid aminotransferase [Pseudoflavonifractor phocaeensis]MBM6939406.1 branched-chain amino acid aminotransferase [Pseudoflavonifractor phocaeensis]
MYEFPIQRAATLKDKPDPKTLVFGKVFTDHMFLLNYDAGQGWHDGRIVPYGDLNLPPSAMVFHYAQEVFEGMKAYRRPDGKVQLFRPMDNVRRLNDSCERLCIPQLPEDLALEGIRALVKVEQDWVPSEPGTSLYIRPFIIATDASLGVHASHSYLFCVICCPVGAYYAEGINPVRIYVENEDVRAVRGGTGYTKCGGNYAASIRAGERAEEQGYAQVLWLDGVERKYIEEVGSMNVMFKVDGAIVTPKLTGSVLPGITRRSCLQLLRDWGYPVEERLVTAQELFDAADAGKLDEAWGTGTAAVVSPIGEMGWNERKAEVNGGVIGPVTQKLYDTLTGIQWGTQPDPYGWTMPVD